MGVLCKLNHSLTFLTQRTIAHLQKKLFLILATMSHCMYSLVICHCSNYFTIFSSIKVKQFNSICIYFQALWVDDIFMGTALLSEFSYHSQNQNYALQAAKDILQLQKYLQKESEFLLQHGFNARTGHHSCCLWARGNTIICTLIL